MKYDNKAIAQELIATAQGDAYHGNALKVALDFPCISGSFIHKAAIQSYLSGSHVRHDARLTLWEAAFIIRDDPNNTEACSRFGYISAKARKEQLQ